MVLEDTNTTSEAFVDSETPFSDGDRYETPTDSRVSYVMEVQPKPKQILINYDDLPQPVMSFRGPDRGAIIRTATQLRKRCGAAALLLGRPLRQEEAEAISYNITHGKRLASLYAPASLAVGAVRWYQTRTTDKWPLGMSPLQESSIFHKEIFGPLRGSVARACWSALRFGIHSLFWSLPMGILFSSYAMSATLVRDVSDPRLRDYNAAIKRALAEQKRPVRDQDVSGTTQNETYEQRRQRQSVQAAAKRFNQSKDTFDDASPTGGAFTSDHYNTNGGPDFVSDATAEQREIKQDWLSKQAEATTQKTNPVPAASSSREFDDHFGSATQDSKPQPSGSAWDRLRQQALEESASKKPNGGQ